MFSYLLRSLKPGLSFLLAAALTVQGICNPSFRSSPFSPSKNLTLRFDAVALTPAPHAAFHLPEDKAAASDIREESAALISWRGAAPFLLGALLLWGTAYTSFIHYQPIFGISSGGERLVLFVKRGFYAAAMGSAILFARELWRNDATETRRLLTHPVELHAFGFKGRMPAWAASLTYGLLLQGLSVSLFYIAAGYVSPNYSALIHCAAPIVVVPLSRHYFRRAPRLQEHPTWRTWAGMSLILLSLALWYRVGFEVGGINPVLGMALAAASAITYGFSHLMVRDLLQKENGLDRWLLAAGTFVGAVPVEWVLKCIFAPEVPLSIGGWESVLPISLMAALTVCGTTLAIWGAQRLNHAGLYSAIMAQFPFAAALTNHIFGVQRSSLSSLFDILLDGVGLWLMKYHGKNGGPRPWRQNAQGLWGSKRPLQVVQAALFLIWIGMLGLRGSDGPLHQSEFVKSAHLTLGLAALGGFLWAHHRVHDLSARFNRGTDLGGAA